MSALEPTRRGSESTVVHTGRLGRNSFGSSGLCWTSATSSTSPRSTAPSALALREAACGGWPRVSAAEPRAGGPSAMEATSVSETRSLCRVSCVTESTSLRTLNAAAGASRIEVEQARRRASADAPLAWPMDCTHSEGSRRDAPPRASLQPHPARLPAPGRQRRSSGSLVESTIGTAAK